MELLLRDKHSVVYGARMSAALPGPSPGRGLGSSSPQMEVPCNKLCGVGCLHEFNQSQQR